jgi:hypothetical protein
LVRQGRSGTGRDWQEQLEDAVAARSTAFAVMVGTKAFDRSEARILSRSGDGTVHLWDVARLGPGNLVEAAADCRSKDVCILRRDFGIDVTKRICAHDGTDPPAPDFRELWIKYAASSSPVPTLLG